MPTGINHPSARPGRSLDGPWQVLVDAYDRGESARCAEDRRPASPAELVEFSFEGADSLDVPGDWNTQRETLFHYEGVVWYRREVELAARPETRYFLHFGAAHYRAAVFVNGQRVGEHVGGFTPFAVEIGEFVRVGANAVVVKVDSRLGDGDVPTRLTDWMHYGGLTRAIRLLELPSTFVARYHVQLAPGSRDLVRGWVQLDGERAEQQVEICLPEQMETTRVRTDAQGFAEFEFATSAELWSPANPRLHSVEIRAETDAVDDQIGFRSIEQRDGEILLNGEPVFLRGISLHEESLLHPGRAHGPIDAEASLALASELGANFVRLAHYPHDEAMARTADQLGLLVWAEIPLYWGIDWESAETFDNAQRQLSELIERDRNRASVILWSVSNETPPSPRRTEFLRELIARARELDPTRLVTSAIFGNIGQLLERLSGFVESSLRGEKPEPPSFVLEDELTDALDVIGWNQYLGWYYAPIVARRIGAPEEKVRRCILDAMPGFRIEVPSGKPLVVSEFGAGARAGRIGGELEVWSETYQARVYRQQLAMLEGAAAWRGLSPWILKDFRTPLRVLGGIQDGWNRKGLVSETGVRKAAFEVLRDYYLAKRPRP